jgi:hypothetical protein
MAGDVYMCLKEEKLATGLRADKRKIRIGPQKPVRAPICKPRWEDFPVIQQKEISDLMGDVLYSLASVYGNWMVRRGWFAKDELEDLLCLFVLVETGYKLPGGDTKDVYLRKLDNLYKPIMKNLKGKKLRDDLEKLLAAFSIIRLLSLVKSKCKEEKKDGSILDNSEESAIRQILKGTPAETVDLTSSSATISSLRRAAGRLGDKRKDSTRRVVCASLLCKALEVEESQKNSEARLKKVIKVPSNKDHPLEGFSMSNDQALQLAVALTCFEEREIAIEFIRQYFCCGLDLRTGLVSQLDIRLGEFEPTRNFLGKRIICYSPWLAVLMLMNCSEIVDVQRGSSLNTNFFTRRCIEAWEKLPITWKPVVEEKSPDVLATIQSGQSEFPALVRQNNLFGFTFQALNYICYHYSVPPNERPARMVDVSAALALEEILFETLTRESSTQNLPLVEVKPWPWGRKYCFTLRHDVDRIPEMDVFDRLMRWEKDRGLGVSWYFIGNRLEKEQLKRIMAANHEIGLHAVKVEDKNGEIKMIEAGIGNSVKGECTHQGGGSDEWMGPLQIMYAAKCSLEYVITQFNNTFPFIFLTLANNGEIESHDDVWCLSYAGTVDKPGKSEEFVYKSFEQVSRFMGNGYHTIISNHPDISFKYLVDLESSLPTEGRANWTASQVVNWWKKIHDVRNFRISFLRRTSNEVVFSLDAECRIEKVAIQFNGLKGCEWALDVPDKIDVISTYNCEGVFCVALAAEKGKHLVSLRNETQG